MSYWRVRLLRSCSWKTDHGTRNSRESRSVVQGRLVRAKDGHKKKDSVDGNAIGNDLRGMQKKDGILKSVRKAAGGKQSWLTGFYEKDGFGHGYQLEEV